MSADPISSEEAINGYSTQATISLSLAQLLGDGRQKFWFAREFFPASNPTTSNPHWIFGVLSRADAEWQKVVADNSVAFARRFDELLERLPELADREKISNLRGNLLKWNDSQFGLHKDEELWLGVSKWLADFGRNDDFRPQVVYLAEVRNAARQSAALDEYLIEPDAYGSFRVHRLLPPGAELITAVPGVRVSE